MKRIAVFGSTGSIGQNTLCVLRHLKGRFKVVALSANTNARMLLPQVKEFQPEFAYMADKASACSLKGVLNTKFLYGQDGWEKIIRDGRLDLAVMAISGSACLMPLLKAIEAKVDVALANKESLVMAGPLVMNLAKANKVKIIPIDSEQSAIWQCLENQEKGKLKAIYLTASGGPFRETPKTALSGVSLKEVLRHPRWKMGRKITVDSATLMNKGLEVLEAMYLFDVAADKIKTLIHPQAIIHSMVEFIDGVTMAQLSNTDMRIPIQYALSYPERLKSACRGVDFYRLEELTFQKPDFRKFRCLDLAYRAARQGGTLPCVLNAANEVSVEYFLRKKLSFLSIAKVIEKVMNAHTIVKDPRLSEIFAADAWAKNTALKFITGGLS